MEIKKNVIKKIITIIFLLASTIILYIMIVDDRTHIEDLFPTRKNSHSKIR